jgi:hypothetical protein
MYSIQKILYLNLSELAYFYLSLDNGVMMTCIETSIYKLCIADFSY